MKSRKRPHRYPEATIGHLNQLLDEALEETFPASDPIAIDVELLRLRNSPEAEVGSSIRAPTER